MALNVEHELHRRRRSRNIGLFVVLAAFVALVFGLTVVKIEHGDMMEGFDHKAQVSATPRIMPSDAGASTVPGTPAAEGASK